MKDGRTVALWLPLLLLARVDAMAKRQNVSRSAMVRLLISEGIRALSETRREKAV